MNCKEGDLAMVLNPNEYAIGKIFTVRDLFFIQTKFGNEPTWVIDPPYPVLCEGRWMQQEYLFDRVVRPIRDNDGKDETLTWADVPKKVTA